MAVQENPFQGAGGTSGGLGGFLLGLAMMVGGFYLLLSSIIVRTRFGLGMQLYAFGGFSVPSGLLLIPLIIGIGFIFYDGSSWIGWALTIGSLIALVVGVLAAVDISLRAITAFELIIILVLSFGGTGLFLRSLKATDRIIN